MTKDKRQQVLRHAINRKDARENGIETHSPAEEAEEGVPGFCLENVGDIPQDTLVEDTDTISYDVVTLFLREIAYKIVEDSLTGKIDWQVHPPSEAPEHVQSENQPCQRDQIQLGLTTYPVTAHCFQHHLGQEAGSSKETQVVTIESTPATTVPSSKPFTSITDVQETITKAQSHFLLETLPETAEEGEGTFSPSRVASQSIASSVLRMLSEFDDSTNSNDFGNTSSVDRAVEQVGPYFVRPSLAPILRRIIDKHGDIAQDCVFKSPAGRTCMLEAVCLVVQDLQSLSLASLQDHHLESLDSDIADAENKGLDVKWLRNLHGELTEALHFTDHYNDLEASKTDLMSRAESMGKTLDSKLAEMQRLQSEIELLECNLATKAVETENLKSTIHDTKSKFKRFKHSVMDGLL